jgi:uncharacterized membrane protein
MTPLEIFGNTLKWWLVVQVLGLLALPLAFRALRWLPGRGYGLAKPLGLLLSGYLLWLLGTFGLLRNTTGGAILALLLVGGLSVAVYLRAERPGPGEKPHHLGAWLRSHQALVIATEVVFALALFGWAYFRAHNPQIVATEKPMEFAFLNSILRDASLPPADPWLAGYDISYYYFGYVLIAMLVNLSGVLPGVGFNLAIALLMALAATGAFSVAYDLVAAHAGRAAPASHAAPEERRRQLVPAAALVTGVLAAVLLLFMGNWEASLEFAHQANMFPASFWQDADIVDLNSPATTGTWDTSNWRFWWWWRASRVVHDCNPTTDPVTNEIKSWPCAGAGGFSEIIDEFPFFSFLLADMHPHVLALPFTLLALGLAFNLLQRTIRAGRDRPPAGAKAHAADDAAGADASGDEQEAVAEDNEEDDDDDGQGFDLNALLGRARAVLLDFGPGYLLLYAVVLGALGFLNTWDFPTYLVVAAGALFFALWRMRGRADGRVYGQTALIAATLLALGFLLYLPFWIGFRSQLGGLLPNLAYPTRMPQFLVFFGPFIVIDLLFAIYVMVRLAQRGRFAWQEGFTFALALLLGLFAALALYVAIGQGTAAGQEVLARWSQYLNTQGGILTLVSSALKLRVSEWWLWFFLALGLGLLSGSLIGGVTRARGKLQAPGASAQPPGGTLSPSTLFALGLMAMSVLVVLFPEFFYLRDLFGSRINTIFKFYYQAWVLSAIGGAFALYFLWTRMSLAPRILVFIVFVAPAIGLGLLYPLNAAPAKLKDWSATPTLDGMVARLNGSPDLAGVQWLNANVRGQPVILEAVGGSYTDYARVSANTGLPTVLGWPGHEDQWRGTEAGALKGTRENDVKTIYQSSDWKTASDLLVQYNVEYVYIGPLERQIIQPGPALDKFKRNMTLVFESADSQVQIFRR